MARNKLPARCIRAMAKALDVGLFKALCDPSRISLVAELAVADGPLRVSELARSSRNHLSVVSRNLALLRRVGVARTEKRGREVLYEIDDQRLVGALRALADAIEDCSSNRVKGTAA